MLVLARSLYAQVDPSAVPVANPARPTVSTPRWVEVRYPTQAKIRLDPDFLPRCTRGVRVCAFR
jgi:hypothetical protein